MGCTVNNFPLRGSREDILEVIGEPCDTNGEVVSVRNGKTNRGVGAARTVEKYW